MAETHSTSLRAKVQRLNYAQSKLTERVYPQEKTCFKCGETKASSDFYKHPEMADGLLGKCKECTKSDTKENYLSDIPKRQEYERKRTSRLARKEQNRKYRKKRKFNQEKYRAGNMLHSAIRDGRLIRQPCEVCGDIKSQGHHDDYSKPLEVRWLCFKHHQMQHGKLKYLKDSHVP